MDCMDVASQLVKGVAWRSRSICKEFRSLRLRKCWGYNGDGAAKLGIEHHSFKQFIKNADMV